MTVKLLAHEIDIMMRQGKFEKYYFIAIFKMALLKPFKYKLLLPWTWKIK